MPTDVNMVERWERAEWELSRIHSMARRITDAVVDSGRLDEWLEAAQSWKELPDAD